PEDVTLGFKVPTDLDWIVLKAIDKDRNRRYVTPNELADDLRRFLKNEPILARPISQTARVWRWCRRHTAVAALTAGLVLALIAGFGGTLWQLQRAEQNAAENLRQVARLNVLTGVNLLQEGDSFKSLLWFAEALALKAGPPERDVVDRLRIASIIAQGPRLAAVITHDGQPVADAAFHSTKDQLATVGRDRRLRLWDLATVETVFLTEPFAERPSEVLFSPDGEVILVGSSEFNQVRMISALDGKPLSNTIPHFAGGANNRPLPPRFDALGERLLTQSAPKTLRVWAVRDGSPLGPSIPLGAPVAWTGFSEHGTQVRTVTQDGKATTWDWRSGSRISNPEPRTLNIEGEPNFDVGRSVFDIRSSTSVRSPDGSRYATLAADHRVRVWDSGTDEPLTPPIDHFTASGPVGFSANGRFFFTMHPAHAVYVWELPENTEPPVLLRPEAPNTLAETGRDGSVIVTRDPGSPIRVRALSGTQEVSLHPASLKEVPVQAWFDDTGQFIILEYPNQRAQVWDATSGLPVTPVFRSRYATNEAAYRTIQFPDFPSDTRHSPPQALAELLSGSRLDGTGGWKPLELGDILARWNAVNRE
ncbi:MAG: hypothetical protein H7A46_25350, partial [Verrucomicrobiales bacterium]|nr:hypothetical protein [Verrucomicrobiales bacterium]